MELTNKTKALMGIKGVDGQTILSQWEHTYDLVDKAAGLMIPAGKYAEAIFDFVKDSNNSSDPNYSKIVYAYNEAMKDSEVHNMPLNELLNNNTALGIFILMFGQASGNYDYNKIR